jgi:chromosome segregation ATPase
MLSVQLPQQYINFMSGEIESAGNSKRSCEQEICQLHNAMTNVSTQIRDIANTLHGCSIEDSNKKSFEITVLSQNIITKQERIIFLQKRVKQMENHIMKFGDIWSELLKSKVEHFSRAVQSLIQDH